MKRCKSISTKVHKASTNRGELAIAQQRIKRANNHASPNSTPLHIETQRGVPLHKHGTAFHYTNTAHTYTARRSITHTQRG